MAVWGVTTQKFHEIPRCPLHSKFKPTIGLIDGQLGEKKSIAADTIHTQVWEREAQPKDWFETVTRLKK